MLEPVCRVPFVAWPTHGLPGRVGALDLVVVMASERAPAGVIATVHEAVRRGSQLLIACPRLSTIAEHATSPIKQIMLPDRYRPILLRRPIVVLDGVAQNAAEPEIHTRRLFQTQWILLTKSTRHLPTSQKNPAKDLGDRDWRSRLSSHLSGAGCAGNRRAREPPNSKFRQHG